MNSSIAFKPESQPATLATLAETANRFHAAYEMALRSAMEHAEQCGLALNQAKGLVGRGNFQGWIKQHCDFPPHAARSYMKRAADQAAAERIASLAAKCHLAAPADVEAQG
jgi:hypothetical protein